MFGMGFAEILIIGVIAILFLGPDKLPETMVQIAKFFKSVKTTVASAKSSIEEELHIEEIKKEANSYKRQLNEATSDLGDLTGVEGLKDDMLEIKKEVSSNADVPSEPSAPAAPQKPEVVTFAKKSKKLDVETPPADDKDTKPSENV